MILIGFMAFVMSGCGGSSSTNGGDIAPDPFLKSIQIQPDEDTIYNGNSLQYRAIGLYERDNQESIRDITKDVIWSSENTEIATINQEGLASANDEGKGGTTTITATKDGISGSTTLNVKNAALTSIKIVRADEDDRTEFVVGTSLQLKALGSYEDGATGVDITKDVDWVAVTDTVTVSTTGLVRALNAGAAKVTASKDAVSASIEGTVVEKSIKEIKIFTDPSNGLTTIDKPILLTAVAIFSDDSTQDITMDATWRSRDDAVDNVIVEKDRKAGIVYARAAEGYANARITAEMNGVEGETHVTFVAPLFDHLEIQEKYCENGDCPVITGKTIDVGIVDDVDKTDPEAYYFTLWAVYKDGRKEYVNQEVNVWSADMVRVYVNGTIGTFVFGRGTTSSPVEVKASWGEKATASFYVNVKENPQRTLVEVRIKNTKDYGWTCNDINDTNTDKIELTVGDNDHHLMACGLYHDEANGDEWVDINNNVAWSSEERGIAFVKGTNGITYAIEAGSTKIHATLAKKTGSIDVEVK